jgi:hypothetical protein
MAWAWATGVESRGRTAAGGRGGDRLEGDSLPETTRTEIRTPSAQYGRLQLTESQPPIIGIWSLRFTVVHFRLYARSSVVVKSGSLYSILMHLHDAAERQSY